MPKACDACHACSAVVYCRADAAFLCVSCDGKVHGANKLASRHERVWMCEVCEVAPAVVTCKADAASLCVACDADIHSANPLAQRHERVPVTPLFEAPSSPPADTLPSPGSRPPTTEDDEAASWLLPHPKIPANAIIRGSAAAGEVAPASPLRPYSPVKPQKAAKLETLADIFSDVDPFLDLDDAGVTGIQPDSLVPVHIPEASEDTGLSGEPPFSRNEAFPLKGTHSYGYGSSTVSHSISCSSLDAAVVPDSSLSDISTPYTDSQSCLQTGSQQQQEQQQQQSQSQQVGGGTVDVVDREARVMRYKEKRQKRKFEKTIRYASRKAYAESRPRIKGRFAKRTNSDVEQMFSSVDSGFGVVPSF